MSEPIVKLARDDRGWHLTVDGLGDDTLTVDASPAGNLDLHVETHDALTVSLVPLTS